MVVFETKSTHSQQQFAEPASQTPELDYAFFSAQTPEVTPFLLDRFTA